MSKYKNKPVKVDGIAFHSQREANRYCELKLLEHAGDIRRLELQPKFPININGKHCFKYIADFAYFEGECRIIEDVKSPITAKNSTYRIKKKCVEAQYDVTIREVF